ncbi:hypothetical protein OAH86_11545, partial [Planktomarina temperata]|nr:hypothetical protein [Planktomarina temperata]
NFSYESVFAGSAHAKYSEGRYISGKETRDGETKVFGLDREFISSTKKIEFEVGAEPSLSNDLAGELNDPQNEFIFTKFSANDLILKVANTFKSTLVEAGVATSGNYDTGKEAALITEVGNAVILEVRNSNFNDNGDNSWANKELQLFISDAGSYKPIGYMNLDTNSWTETWNNNQLATSENINFNSNDYQFLGNSRIDSNGFVDEMLREVIAATAEGNTYTGDMDDNDTTSASDKISFIRQTFNMGESQQDGSVTWNQTRVEDFVYNSDGNMGKFLGGYEIQNGQKTTWDENWNVVSQEVDKSSLILIELTSADKLLLPTSFAEATHKQVNYYDKENLNKVVTNNDGTSVTLRGDGEALYFKQEVGADPVLIGKENFYSFSDENNGHWNHGGNFDLVGSASGGENWDWAGNFQEDSRGGSMNVSYGVNTDGAGAYAEIGTRTDAWEENGQIQTQTESWVYYYDETRKFLGGYEVNEEGLRVNIDENFQPTGDLVSADGKELSLFDLMEVKNWDATPAEFAKWETSFLSSGDLSDIAEYNELPDPISRELYFKGAIFDAMAEDFGGGLRNDPLLDGGSLVGIQIVGSNYAFEITGDLITEIPPGGTESDSDVVGGIVHSGKVYRVDGADYVMMADGSNDFELPATFFGSILEAFGIFDGAKLEKNWEEQRLEVYGLPTGIDASALKLELKNEDTNDYQIVAVGGSAGFSAQSGTNAVFISYSDIRDAIEAKLEGSSQIDLRTYDTTLITYFDIVDQKTVEVGERDSDDDWLPVVRADETNKVVFVELVPDSVTELKLELRDTQGTETKQDDHWNVIGKGSAVGFEQVGASLNGFNTWKISFDKINAAIKDESGSDSNFDVLDYEYISVTYQESTFNTKHHGSMARPDYLVGANDPFTLQLINGDIEITFEDDTITSSDMANVFLNDTVVDLNSSNNVFYDKAV